MNYIYSSHTHTLMNYTHSSYTQTTTHSWTTHTHHHTHKQQHTHESHIHTRELHVLIKHTNSHTLMNYMHSSHTNSNTLMNHTYTLVNYMYSSNTQTATHSWITCTHHTQTATHSWITHTHHHTHKQQHTHESHIHTRELHVLIKHTNSHTLMNYMHSSHTNISQDDAKHWTQTTNSVKTCTKLQCCRHAQNELRQAEWRSLTHHQSWRGRRWVPWRPGGPAASAGSSLRGTLRSAAPFSPPWSVHRQACAVGGQKQTCVLIIYSCMLVLILLPGSS